jgi:EAL domain-containing protein (putative c-di-GMP-specific phosphodiesterase class I)
MPGKQWGYYSPNPKANFQLERVVKGWRGVRVLDLYVSKSNMFTTNTQVNESGQGAAVERRPAIEAEAHVVTRVYTMYTVEGLSIGEIAHRLNALIGVSVYPQDGRDTDTLLKNADAAMYRAKDLGRNNLQFYAKEMNARASDQLSFLSSLRRALERKEFFLHYQPQVDLKSGAVIGVEALLRWAHPQFGVVPPDQFIPAAEDSGLIVPVGEWVLRTACGQLKLWQNEGKPPVKMAVNLSAREFQGANLLQGVTRIIEDIGIDPAWLEIEITESTIMQHGDTAIFTLRKFREMGMALALDDFGTGYSSLSYLKRFPIDRLKIDRSFVRDIEIDPDDAAIVRGIVALSHSIGLRVLAEGVETLAQMQLLQQCGCDEAQGYYFSEPVPADQVFA